jgi:hypothetical protein
MIKKIRNALGGTETDKTVGVLGLDLPQFGHQAVVLRIADDGVVEDVIAVIVVAHFLLEIFITLSFVVHRSPRA